MAVRSKRGIAGTGAASPHCCVGAESNRITPLLRGLLKAEVRLGECPRYLQIMNSKSSTRSLLLVGRERNNHSRRCGIIEIERVINCSTEQAGEILSDLLDRKLIEPDITRGGELDARKPMPIAQWRWMRP